MARLVLATPVAISGSVVTRKRMCVSPAVNPLRFAHVKPTVLTCAALLTGMVAASLLSNTPFLLKSIQPTNHALLPVEFSTLTFTLVPVELVYKLGNMLTLSSSSMPLISSPSAPVLATELASISGRVVPK